MNFLTPAAFTLALLLPIVLAMYFLKLRREDRLVSSVYLWQRLVRDYEANAPWQRLRRNLLLLLQLLFLTALILALARPFFLTTGAAGHSLILVVDTSASMGATDVAPSRLEVAKARARGLIATLPDEAQVTVIAAGYSPKVLISGARDRRQVGDVIDGLRPGRSGSDLSTALSLAAAIAARQPEAEIVILSDGNVDLQRTTVPARVRYIPIGTSGENQAISALSLRELAAGQVLSLFAQVTNHGRREVTRRLDILIDGQLVNAHELTVPAGDSVEIVQDDLPTTARVIEARLARAGLSGSEDTDYLAADDRAWAVHSRGQPASVLLVTEGNLFLETALRLLPNLELTVVAPADYSQSLISNTRSPIPNTQLTIFDRTVPADLPPNNALFIAPPDSLALSSAEVTAWFTRTGTLEQPVAQAASADEPLLRYVDVSGLQILEAAQIPLPSWARPVINTAPNLGAAGSGRWPLLFAGQVEGRRVAVLAFDLRASDLVLRVAFPLLLSNLISWLVPGNAGLLPDQVAPGDTVTFAVPPRVSEVIIRRPDGRSIRLTPEAGPVVFDDTALAGPYEVILRGEDGIVEQVAFAVNLFSPGESAIAPHQTLPVDSTARGSARERTGSQARRELWRPLAFVALLLLVGEWLVYRRAAVAELVAPLRRVKEGLVS